MYIHIGQEKIIKSDSVIGIFDLDNTTVSKITRETLKKSEQEKRVVTIGYELPKSFVLCDDGKKGKVFISPLASTTIIKRAQSKGF